MPPFKLGCAGIILGTFRLPFIHSTVLIIAMFSRMGEAC